MLRSSFIKLSLFYLISIGFILLNIWFIVQKNSYIVNLLPLALIVLLVVIFSFDKIIYLIALMAPLSIRLNELMPGLDFDMYLPTEPLLFGLLVLLLLKILHERNFDSEIIFHPVSLVIYFNLFWILMTTMTSSMPVVSLKFFLSRLWFVAGLYFLTTKLFAGGKNLELYIWLYVFALLAVILYSTYRHLGYGLWDRQAAHYVVSPFYKDHTSYGAALAMYIPFLFLFSFLKTYNRKIRIISIVILGLLIMGLVLSYSRAAWLSVMVALIVWVIIKLRIRFKTLFITFASLLAIILLFQTQILMKLEENSEQSSANLATHISSMSNISTDASNLERINRWSCAMRMFADRPVFGFGPGTYMFRYAPYQLSKDRTIISTNSADGGNAHSEYLGPLSESGVLGLLSYLMIVSMVIYVAVNTYSRLKDPRLKSFVLASLLGLITYYVHGFLNNFLDTDKISVPFWGFTAIIVAIDIHSRKQTDDNQLAAGKEDKKSPV